VSDAIRGTAWALGAPARVALIGLIRLYRLLLSGSLGGQCRFYPSCSHYGEEAIRVHGAVKGVALTVWRIARCGPFTKGGVDHVPPSRRHASYDAVSLRAEP
jgi:putative membrane protein insertion efficiency factor